MTSAQTMRRSKRSSSPPAVPTAALLLLATILLTACETLRPPREVAAPFEQTELWAVAPFANESGVSVVDGAHTADLFARQLQQVEGINSLPVNRVLAAMRSLDIPTVASAGDARALMNVLDVDGLIVGTVTVYEPYRPLQFGAAVQLFRRNGAHAHVTLPDLVRSPTDMTAAGMLASGAPTAEAAGVYDASNHQTLATLQAYAEGRSEPESAYGRDVYRVRMELYTEFVCHQLILDLLDAERNRIQTMAQESERH